MKLILMSVILVGFLYCASSKKSLTQSNTNTINTNAPHDSLYLMRVSFISRGSGTDRKAKQTYEQFIRQFEIDHNVMVQYEKTPWGREGEVDYCIKSITADTTLQRQFILQTNDQLKDKKLVRIYENVPCKHKK